MRMASERRLVEAAFVRYFKAIRAAPCHRWRPAQPAPAANPRPAGARL